MLIKLIRKYIGSTRLLLTLLVLLLGSPVVIADVWFGIEVTSQTYGFLSGVLVQVIAYQFVETKRSSDAKTN